MTIYIYRHGSSTIETLNVDEIPEGVSYETIEREETVDMVSLINEALQIDLYYTELISNLLRKHIEKLSIDGVSIPQSAIDERDRLRAECNQKIIDLGITSFSYRQSNLKL
jgi:tryptophan synthase alpha subunit